ncbi:response regulator [Niabella aurantiaca]|uniref:response regulator n=1 Tax=Niabella aurantiaca TaxID=379900 RepID=UPI000366BAFB|nr:response regulator transcription factor [Niabella aurantiaca]
MKPGSKIKIIIADDQEDYHKAITTVLNDWNEATVIGTVYNGARLLELLQQLTPDVVIMDLQMPVMDGIEATRQVRILYPQIKILAYTVFDDEALILKMMQAGASGYVIKTATSLSLQPGIEALLEGKNYYCASSSMALTNLLLKTFEQGQPPDGDQQLFNFNELAILRLICKQLTNREISDKLYMSIKTVEKYRALLFSKTGVKNVAGLVAYAVENGLYHS